MATHTECEDPEGRRASADVVSVVWLKRKDQKKKGMNLHSIPPPSFSSSSLWGGGTGSSRA
eukprot:878354-Rhodomonas_salina.2